MAGVKGMKHRRARPKKHTDALLMSKIENQLIEHALGEREMSPTQVQAAKAVYDKLRPTLSSIEQTQTDPRDQADATQLAARLAAMFNEKPELLEQIKQLMGNAAQQSAEVKSEERVTH